MKIIGSIRLGILVRVLPLGLVVPGCGNLQKAESIDTRTSLLEPSSEDAGKGDENPPPSKDVGPIDDSPGPIGKQKRKAKKAVVTVEKSVDNLSDTIRVKSFELLRSSIASCFSSSNFTLVRPDMLVGSVDQAPLTEGLVRFIMPDQGVTAGIDILDFERNNLGGDESVGRTTIGADSLSAVYLRSLGLVANVVAHTCELDDPFCACADEGDARAMIGRCLPQLAPSSGEFDAVVKAMSAQCSIGPAEHRQAIAAMISSYAFAQGR